MRTPSKWNPTALSHTIAVDARTQQRLMRLAYKAGGEDVRERMAAIAAEAIAWWAERAEITAALARAERLLMDSTPAFADGTQPGTEQLHGDRCMCAGAGCRERPAR